MSREMLRAYFKAEAAHKAMHRLTRAFEEDSSNEEMLKWLNEIISSLEEVRATIRKH